LIYDEKEGLKMIKDKQSNFNVKEESLNKNFKGVHVNIKSTEAIIERLDELILKMEEDDECKFAYTRLESCFDSIKKRLPKEDLKLVTDIDDCFTEILIVLERYFYVKGYNDGARSKGVLKRILAGMKKKWSTVKPILS
jgi:hypothetical protein